MQNAVPPQDLKELREARVLTQAELGGQGHVSAYENGKKMPGSQALKSMAKRLGVPPTQVYAACKESCRRASLPRDGKG